jgi:type I restriction enzyme M protein
VVLANPPYSIKQWNREAWTTDPWGRNFLGTPPQGRADYAFFQHILEHGPEDRGAAPSSSRMACSFARRRPSCGRSSSRPTSSSACSGSGPNLFYNSPMEACVVFCRSQEAAEARGKVLLIDAVNEVARERAVSFLRPEHQAFAQTTWEQEGRVFWQEMDELVEMLEKLEEGEEGAG